MSSIEERLARDIAEVTGGVVVTDSDLREARTAVNDRIESRRRRDRRRIVVAAAAATVVLAAVGVTAFELLDDDDNASVRPSRPAPTDNGSKADSLPGPAPTRELLRGVWRLDNGGVLVNFFASGTVQFDQQGMLYSHPVLTGAYALDGEVISVTITDTEQSGCLGKTFALRTSLPKVGQLQFVTSPGPDVGCSPVPVADGSWEQALPTRNKYLAGLENSKDPSWHPLSGRAALKGVFLASGGGHLLELDPDGSYYVAAVSSDEPVDQGQWALHGSDLTLTSSDSSTECSKGDALTLNSLEEVNPGTTVFRGAVAQNTCHAAWTPTEWILIPNMAAG
jgi:hypothetical protein